MSSRLVESPGCGKLVIAEPTALAVLDFDKIVVWPAPGETAQFSDGKWEGRLPKLVQARILQSFENASRLRAVVRPADKISGDFQLVMDIRAFELSVADGRRGGGDRLQDRARPLRPHRRRARVRRQRAVRRHRPAGRGSRAQRGLRQGRHAVGAVGGKGVLGGSAGPACHQQNDW